MSTETPQTETGDWFETRMACPPTPLPADDGRGGLARPAPERDAGGAPGHRPAAKGAGARRGGAPGGDRRADAPGGGT